MLTRLLLLAPHEQPGFGTTRGERIERRLMRAFVKEFWQRLFLRTAHVHRFAINNLSDVRRLIVHIADQDGLRWTDDDAGRLQTNIDAMRAEVAFLGRMIFGIDEDRVVRTGGHAGLAADADRFVEVNYAISALEHRRCRARGHTRGMSALIAARHLMRAPHLRKHANIDVLDVCARDADRNYVFRFACGRARVAPDAAGMIDHLRPLHAVLTSCLLLDHVPGNRWRQNISLSKEC